MSDNNGTSSEIHHDNGTGHTRAHAARARARAMKDSAMSTLSDTPGWVWAVIGGVVLLIIGIVAASKMRSRYVAEPEDDNE